MKKTQGLRTGADASGAGLQSRVDVSDPGVQGWGWRGRGTAPQPYMAPALLASRTAVEAIYAREVRAEVGSIHGA